MQNKKITLDELVELTKKIVNEELHSYKKELVIRESSVDKEKIRQITEAICKNLNIRPLNEVQIDAKKVKLKIPVEIQPQQPIQEPQPQVEPQDDFSGVEMQQEPAPNVNKFGKQKFDAGIDVDEKEDPKNYIEKLTGKLAQTIRTYNQTETDSNLNKFVINSIVPATIPSMETDDVKDVIKKINDNKSAE